MKNYYIMKSKLQFSQSTAKYKNSGNLIREGLSGVLSYI